MPSRRGIAPSDRGDRLADAFGALTYLAKRIFVDPKRIGVVGFSEGASTALQLASAHSFDLFELPDHPTTKAVVAFYPACDSASDEMDGPTLILIGELDEWTRAKECEYLMERLGGKGAPMKLVISPGAHHAFFDPTLEEGVRYYGYWLQYNAAASEHAINEMRDFLATELSAN
jgi:dienelactone hydrolase